MTADDRIYIRFKGRTIGPLSLADAKTLVRRGQITPLHEISSDSLSWRPAQDHSELFPKQSRSTSETVALAEPKAETAKPAISNVQWHVHIDGTNLGPLEEFQVKQWIASGRIEPSTLVWQEGMDDWAEIQTVCPSWLPRRAAANVQQPVAAVADGGELQHVTPVILRSRAWAMFLAVLGLCIFSAQSALWLALFLMSVATKGAVEGVVVSIANLAFSIAALIASVLLMQYVNSVGVIRYQPTSANLQLALSRLSVFWKFTGILMLVTLSVAIALIFLAYLLGLGIAQAFTPNAT